MTVIDLRSGRVAWYSCDDVDVDTQRNVLRDRSGHGRHMAMSGGVTTGAPSPVGDALSADGSDDELTAGTGHDLADTEITCAALFKQDSATTDHTNDYASLIYGGRGQSSGGGSDDGFSLGVNGQRIRFEVGDGSDGTWFDGGSTTLGAWHLAIGRYDGATGQVFLDFEAGDQKDIALSGIGDTISDFKLLHDPNTGHFPGDIAFAGVWDRALSWPELQELGRMTGRQVMRL